METVPSHVVYGVAEVRVVLILNQSFFASINSSVLVGIFIFSASSIFPALLVMSYQGLFFSEKASLRRLPKFFLLSLEHFFARSFL